MTEATKKNQAFVRQWKICKNYVNTIHPKCMNIQAMQSEDNF